MMNLSSIEGKKALEELRCKKSKSAFSKMLEKNKFINILIRSNRLGGSPLNYFFRLQQSLFNKSK